jgi:hypothetical protein
MRQNSLGKLMSRSKRKKLHSSISDHFHLSNIAVFYHFLAATTIPGLTGPRQKIGNPWLLPMKMEPLYSTTRNESIESLAPELALPLSHLCMNQLVSKVDVSATEKKHGNLLASFKYYIRSIYTPLSRSFPPVLLFVAGRRPRTSKCRLARRPLGGT